MAASDEAAAAAREVRNSTEAVTDMEHVEAMECQEARALTPTERDKELEQLKALLVEKQQELREAQQRAEQAERACARASENPQADKERCIPEWALAAAELERLDQGRVRAIFEEADEFISTEEEIVVPNEQHFLHVRFRCVGQQFPETNGRPGFQLSTCCCSRELVVKDLLKAVPSPAAEERIECVLDAARILTVWWGPGSISKKVQWICDRNHLALNTKAVGVAYAFFRAKCSHVLLMCGLLPQSSRLRHPLLKGWPYDVTRIVEHGFEIGRRLDWSAAAPTATLSDEHSRVIVVVPECLTRLKHCMAGPHTTFFYYRTFFDLKKKHTKLFANEVGRVVLVLPPREPDDPYCWIPFVAALDLWLTCGAHVWIVNGPRSCEDASWDRMNESARHHLLGYLDFHPQFAMQVNDLIPSEPGVLRASMACLRVGVIQDPRKWMTARQALEFFNFLRAQLDGMNLEPVKLPKGLEERLTGNPSEKRSAGPGKPAHMDGRISKRHLKRVEKRRQRSEQRDCEHRMSKCDLR